MKHVVIVDEDIDVFDGTEVEWAIATRVQADRDVVIVSDARSEPLDLSLPPTLGRIPTTAKCGVDATIPDNVPRSRYERIRYAYADEVNLVDFQGEWSGQMAAATLLGDLEPLVGRMKTTLGDPIRLTKRYDK